MRRDTLLPTGMIDAAPGRGITVSQLEADQQRRDALLRLTAPGTQHPP